MARKVTKPNRVKLGLSVEQDADSLLTELALKSGKTKSRIFEEAIRIMKSREDIIAARMKDFLENGEEALLTFEEILDNRMKNYEKHGDKCLVGPEEAIDKLKGN